jgi:mannose-1-phosphate guanylyltransferase/phosphomannomutase
MATKFVSSPAKINQALKQLSNIVVTLGADIGILLDQEAENIFFVDEKGRILKPDIAFAAVCKMVGEVYPEGNIGAPVNVTRIIDQIVPDRVKRTKASSRGMMEEKELILIGDGRGGFIFPQFHQSFDGMFAVIKILELLSKTEKSLGDIAKDIPPFCVLHKKVHCSWEKKGTIMRKLIETVTDKPVELIDGVKIYHKNDWVLLLPDLDEAIFHIYAESDTSEKAEALIEEYERMIREEL